MDRLLCGDVGYGKTEVALRVAFKAVMDKKQVAYLVPTTVLSLQQFRTFKSRMENFGIRVEMLSRFKSKKEQTQILKDLVDGKIDIIVGTHRLLSKDVFFKDLGLLIIDEEHRFGVKAKESIKVLKETVDVLSMTATPIPRTLHMSMIGIRQMSTLTEPPIERLPVHTYVLEYEQNVVKDAIEKELLRDGQVFYINNRVNNIEEISNKVRSIVPDARIAFAHGQMDPHQIEDVMIRFINHELDVLVCTTILESGIDIPNANTIIIENADKLGLAQLYQIRGRVGRSSRVSYAYVTYEKNKQISEVSEKRLKAIRDFTEFGSGFKIALRDLEIRGAGNMLGREQHGHMANVGYELYLALLEKAIKEEKEGIKDDSIIEIQKEVKIDLNVSAYISDGYIKNPIQKIAMYQKISDIESKEQSLDVIDELLDRYGDIPKETENLIKIVEIRNAARRLGITRILQTENLIKFEPSNLKIPLTNINNNDILIHVQLEIEKLEKLFKEEKGK
jgi:transcription-repair coupling factor (superfamily II helicase)